MNIVTGWLIRKGLEFVEFEVPFKQWQADWHEKQRIAREAREARERKDPPTPPAVTPGAAAAIAIVSVFLLRGASCTPPQWVPQPGDVADMRVYCCDAVNGRPERCSASMKRALCPAPTATPMPVTCPLGWHVVTDLVNDAVLCVPNPTPTPVPTFVPTAPPPPPPPTRTASPTPAPTSVPTIVPTAPSEEGCLVRSSVPDVAVRVLTTGGCKPGFVRVDDARSGAHGCVAYWHCADGNDAYNIPNRVGADFHFGNLQLGDPDGFIHNDEHPRVDAFGRRLNADGSIITAACAPPPPEGDGYCPEAWESGTICRPLLCTATPVPTAAPTVPSATPTLAPPVGSGCGLPPGDGNGENCPQRGAGEYRMNVDLAIEATRALHPEIFADSAGAYVRPGQENAYYAYVLSELSSMGFCGFRDRGNELAIKRTNAFSEQYATLASDGRVRMGANTYRATCSPAWRDIPSSTAPLLVLVKVGDDCQNPKEGPRYARHECVVTTTGVYRNPRTPHDVTRDAPCDREPALTDFCNRESQDDPRGVVYTVTDAEDLGLDDKNPQQIVVRFTPGQRFKVCARPYDDVKNSHGVPVPVDRPAEQCKEQVH